MKLSLKSDIALANSIVSIAFACKHIGMADIDYGSSGAKINCPFETLFHPGGGKSFRMYEDANSAYCYACGQQYRPVTIVSQAKDISLDEAAEQLLEAFGYKAKTAESRYAEAVATMVKVDQHALEEALKTFCARNYPEWEILQFDDAVASKYRQCVELLPSVRTAEDTKTWLKAAKTAMTRLLGAAE